MGGADRTFGLKELNMIERPILRGEILRPSTCGRTAVENDEMAFWQSLASRHGHRADVIRPVDLTALAQEIRSSWPR